ncbi:hypothetical protein D5S18_24865 [Nocardia panacis]|uniref:Uncharacterized protein n=2 Tax=Nocardia panacis TaxID=2340916 RepID=A0A3A4K993_9NOCA|nr:hypothetical protein D5S18_24865 [Nocardia panacis]
MDLVIPDDVVLDHSAQSLEMFVDVMDDVDDVPDFDEAAAAYIGQTLLVLAGGEWGWDDAPDSSTFGQPLVVPSPELGLAPLAPIALMGEGDNAIIDTYVCWEQAVNRHTAAHPDWRPVKAHTPGLDLPTETSDSNCDRLSAWLVQRERGFPHWVAVYGSGTEWDFSPSTLDDLAGVLFRVTPTPEQFGDPTNAEFVESATWYLGETMRRADPGEWIAGERNFHLRKHPGDDWSPTPKLDLEGAVRDGNPLRLHNAFREWTTPCDATDRPEPEYRWTGTAWQTPVHDWVESIAARIDTLAGVIPSIVLDYSAESLHRLEAYCHTAGTDLGRDLAENLGAYVGEALLRIEGGCWTLDEAPRSVSFGRPVVHGDRYMSGQVSPIDLVLMACRWSAPGALTHAYKACERLAAEQVAKDPSWHPTREPTPGLDPAPAPTLVESWCTAREHDFPAWTARYGAGRTWDFSRNSLVDLADVVLTILPTVTQFQDPAHAAFVDEAAWYYGEVLRRAKPSRWDHNDNLDANDRWHRHVSALGPDTGFPLSVFVVQDLHSMVAGPLRDGRHFWPPDLIERRPKALRGHFDSWVTAALRERAKDALRRRNRKKSRRKQPDADYALTWTTTQAQQFPAWRQRYGTTLGREFSPESLDMLETVLRQITPTPEELLEDTENAEFLDVAAWYYGETVRRATHLAWKYDRNYGPDCYLSDDNTSLNPVYDLAATYRYYDIGALRDRYDHQTRQCGRASPQ